MSKKDKIPQTQHGLTWKRENTSVKYRKSICFLEVYLCIELKMLSFGNNLGCVPGCPSGDQNDNWIGYERNLSNKKLCLICLSSLPTDIGALVRAVCDVESGSRHREKQKLDLENPINKGRERESTKMNILVPLSQPPNQPYF